MPRATPWLVPWLAALLPGPAGAQEGYERTEDGLRVYTAAHWAAWEHPASAVVLDSASGRITPRRYLASFDATDGADRFDYPIGDEGTYAKVLAALRKEQAPLPLNIRRRQATAAGFPVYVGGGQDGEPLLWYYYHGGVREAGSSPQMAASVVDNDPETYWEPSRVVSEARYAALPPEERGPVHYLAADGEGQERRVLPGAYERTPERLRRRVYHTRSLADWYLEIDLGRVVPVQRIVLRYLEAPRGDPLRQVRILTTPSADRHAPLELVARSTSPNDDRPVVEFDLDPEGIGAYLQVHRLRLAVTDSELDRSRKVSQEEFESLPLAEQGSVDYYIVDALGGETRVEAETYERVGAARQGRRVFWRAERPRFAEVEVWSEGDNIAAGVLSDGGADLVGDYAPDGGFDGLYDTFYEQVPWRPENTETRSQDNGLLTVDLGAVFWIGHLRAIMTCCRQGEDEIVFLASDGSRDASGQLQWTRAVRRLGVPGFSFGAFAVEGRFDEPLRARYLRSYAQFPGVSSSPGWRGPTYRTHELQVYGEGYPAEVVLTSPLIPLDGSVVADRIEWEDEAPVPVVTEVEIRTRSGEGIVEETEYYNSAGFRQSQTVWRLLPSFYRGPKVTRTRTGQGWSPWSQRYSRPGERVTSPSPRRWLQVQARLLTSDPAVAPSLQSLRIGLRVPAAQRVVGEVWPDSVAAGEEREFEVYIRPSFAQPDSGSVGFDEVLLDPGSLEGVELLDLAVGSQEQMGLGQALVLEALRGAGEEAGQVMLRLPRRVTALPAGPDSRVYHRVVLRSDEVPVDDEGRHLIEVTYLNLPEPERGRALYLRRLEDGRVDTVDRFAYAGLAPAARAGVRYFRKVEGGEFPFDRAGAPLNGDAYEALPPEERGAVVAAGELVRLRLRATVARYGTTLGLWIRDSRMEGGWQEVDPGEATGLSPGRSLTLVVPSTRDVIEDLQVTPRILSPNGDGVHDEAHVRFTLPSALQDRHVELAIQDLAGRRLRLQQAEAREIVRFTWDGRDDDGHLVAPGLYPCRLRVAAQARGATNASAVRVVGVAY